MRRAIKAWLKIWLYLISGIAGGLAVLLFVHWKAWPLYTKLAVAADISLVLHVLEEWKLPGGFYYMYNLQHKDPKELADRYPMSQLTDMITNFIPIALGCVMLAFGMPRWCSLMWFLLSLMEVIVHTLAGRDCLHLFGARGKRGLYNPGLATAYGCFLPIAIFYFVCFAVEGFPSWSDIALALIGTFALSYLVIDLPESRLKDPNSPYAFDWGKGYFAKFDE